MQKIAITAVLMVGMAACAHAQAGQVVTVQEAEKTAATNSVVHPAEHPSEMLLGPAQMRHFYNMDGVKNRGEGQTIAIIINGHDEVLEHDLAIFSTRFGLPLCTVKSGCLRQISMWEPGAPPETRASSHGEVTMDVEWSHAFAPAAKLIVVEAPRGVWADFLRGVDLALANGATVVSLSLAQIQSDDRHETNLKDDAHFAKDGAVFVSAGGDHAHGARWPASSPDVVGVGGTVVVTDASGARLGEIAWKSRPSGSRYVGTGGGISRTEAEPAAQIAYGIPNDPQKMRGTPDVAAYAASHTSIAVFNSNPSTKTGVTGWHGSGGTSAGTPMWAGLLAVANSMRAAAGKSSLAKYAGKDGGRGTLAAIYTVARQTPQAFFDITEGSNAQGSDSGCGSECEAGVGYDYVTGLGSPNAAVLLRALAGLP